MADFLAGEIPTAAALNTASLAGRCVGRAQRITNSSTSTSSTAVAVLRLDDIPITAGRLYRIETSRLAVDGATAADTLAAELRYTTDGTTPTTASSILPGTYDEVDQPNASRAEFLYICASYAPAGDETLSLLLTIHHGSGTGAMGLQADGTLKIIEILVWDCGVDPGDTGVDL